jgi:hypothetical protein
MTPDEYLRVLHGAHGLRGLARQIAEGGALDAAIDAIARADSAGAVLDPTLYRDRQAAMAQDEATLRAVRVLAQLGDTLAGEGSAPEPGPAERASGPSRGTHASSPARLRTVPDLAS